MNPQLQQFIPGLGQQITPEDLMSGLQMFKSQGATLGNPQDQEKSGGLVQALQSYGEAMRSMPQSDYAQGSGGLGSVAMMAEAYGQRRESEGKGSIFGGSRKEGKK